MEGLRKAERGTDGRGRHSGCPGGIVDCGICLLIAVSFYTLLKTAEGFTRDFRDRREMTVWISWTEWYCFDFLSWLCFLLIVFLGAELFYCMIRKREKVGKVYRYLFYAAGAYMGNWGVFSCAYLMPVSKSFFDGAVAILNTMIWSGFWFLVVALLFLAGGMVYCRVRREPFGMLPRLLRLSVLLMLLLGLMLFDDKILFYDY